MAFKRQAEHKETTFVKLTDIPLLIERCKEKGFCKSGVFQVEHLVFPSKFPNYTLVNYKLGVRVNISEGNESNFKFLTEYRQLITTDPVKVPWLGIEITDRTKGWAAVGTDDEKYVTWAKASLGMSIKTS